MSAEERIQHLLEKYLDGTTTPEDLTTLRDLLGQTKFEELAGELIEKTWSSDEAIIPIDEKLLDTKFDHVINEGGRRRRKRLSPFRISRNSSLTGSRLVAAAAMLLVAVGLGMLLLKGTSVTNILSAGFSEPIQLVEVRTGAGETKVLTLPDGSRVWLNARSVVSYPKVYPTDSRTAKLEGEAYFEIAKDKTKPFVVEAGAVEVRVLGTHFNVNAERKAESVTTTLFEGLVEMKHEASRVKLYPGQQARYERSKGGFNHTTADTSSVAAWRRGEFYFDNTPVKDIMSQVSHWYGLSVSYPEGIPDVRLSGVIPRTKGVTPVLEILAATRRVEFNLQKDSITVNEKK